MCRYESLQQALAGSLTVQECLIPLVTEYKKPFMPRYYMFTTKGWLCLKSFQILIWRGCRRLRLRVSVVCVFVPVFVIITACHRHVRLRLYAYFVAERCCLVAYLTLRYNILFLCLRKTVRHIFFLSQWWYRTFLVSRFVAPKIIVLWQRAGVSLFLTNELEML